MQKIKNVLIEIRSLLTCSRGQGLVEYALLLVLVAMVVFFILTTVGQQLGNKYETINSSVDNAGR
ncbi:hypothetical protein [Geomonas subterranea]|uniref:hypothetical protein n=1 Tax=Geomonas subterranea TaxID=2847989 RepID=UPI001CD74A21|nr:hypothetical protein [Geomonas fuzhouensis]